MRSRVAKGSIGFTARLASDVPSAPPNRDHTQKDEAFLDLVEPADLVTYGFIPESVLTCAALVIANQRSGSSGGYQSWLH